MQQQYLRAGLLDEMHFAYVPLLLGRGERLWEGLDQAPAGYEVAEFVGTPAALHVRVVKGMTPQTALGMAASRNDVIIGTSKSARFTTVTWEVPGSIAS
jgi:hypothetical protein